MSSHRLSCPGHRSINELGGESCGFQIFADTSIRLQHIGIYSYSWEDIGGGLPRYPSYRLRISDGDEPADA